jgi:hypothetical protein
MPYNVPSISELVQRNISNIESSLNTKTPPAEKAFNSVLAVTEGMNDKQLYAYAADLARENLALTASEEGLAKLGEEYGVYRVQPSAWEGRALFDMPDGMTLFLGTSFISANGLQYQAGASATAPFSVPGSGVLVDIACEEAGPSGNLSVNDTLTIQTPIAGAGRTARITETVKLGTPIEDLEIYHQRVLDAIRSDGGGGNSSDLRSWAQAVPGVRRAYPFSGERTVYVECLPGERTVYVECLPDINSEGVPPQSLLDLVRAALLADPDTGVSREILGLTGDTLYVKPITRTGLYVTVDGMKITSGNMGDAEQAVRQAMEALFKTFRPFVQGLDPDFERMDCITASIIAREAQNVLDAYGGTAQNVLFGTSPGSYLGKYDLKRGECVKLAGLVFQGAE